MVSPTTTSTTRPVELTVTKATLTIKANNATKTYGNTYAFDETPPSVDLTVTGLKNSDTVTNVTLASPGAAASATVAGSPYTITPSAATGSGLANYDIDYQTGELTVTKATLTVTTDDKSREYGEPNGSFTVGYTGFKNGQTLATSDVSRGTGLLLDGHGHLHVAGSPYPITCTTAPSPPATTPSPSPPASSRSPRPRSR